LRRSYTWYSERRREELGNAHGGLASSVATDESLNSVFGKAVGTRLYGAVNLYRSGTDLVSHGLTTVANEWSAANGADAMKVQDQFFQPDAAERCRQLGIAEVT